MTEKEIKQKMLQLIKGVQELLDEPNNTTISSVWHLAAAKTDLEYALKETE